MDPMTYDNTYHRMTLRTFDVSNQHRCNFVSGLLTRYPFDVTVQCCCNFVFDLMTRYSFDMSF